jgi:hypothetical protein
MLTATVEPDYQNVKLDYRVPVDGELTFSRVGPSGVAATVRGWSAVPVSSGVAVTARDYEAPIGVPLTYTAALTGPPPAQLHPNPSVETDLSGLNFGFAAGGAATRDSTQASDGAWSVKLLNGNAVASCTVRNVTARFPVIPGRAYSASADYRPDTTARTLTLFIDWYDAAGVRIFTTSGFGVETVGEWTRVLCENRIAPVNAVDAQLIVQVDSQGVGEAHYIDRMLAYQAIQMPPFGATATITVPSGGCSDTWLNDLARVGNTLKVVLEQIPELAYQVPASVHDVITRRSPIVTSDVAHTPAVEVSILTASDDERERARAMLGNGVPILLRTPPEDGIGNMYLSVVDFKEQRVVTRGTVPDRRFVISARHVSRPDPDLFAPSTAVLYQNVRASYATYQELLADRATYDALLYGWSGVAPSDIVPWPPDDV